MLCCDHQEQPGGVLDLSSLHGEHGALQRASKSVAVVPESYLVLGVMGPPSPWKSQGDPGGYGGPHVGDSGLAGLPYTGLTLPHFSNYERSVLFS